MPTFYPIYHMHVHARIKSCVILGIIGPDFVHQRERLLLELRYHAEGLKEEHEGKAGKGLENRFWYFLCENINLNNFIRFGLATFKKNW